MAHSNQVALIGLILLLSGANFFMFSFLTTPLAVLDKSSAPHSFSELLQRTRQQMGRGRKYPTISMQHLSLSASNSNLSATVPAAAPSLPLEAISTGRAPETVPSVQPDLRSKASSVHPTQSEARSELPAPPTPSFQPPTPIGGASPPGPTMPTSTRRASPSDPHGGPHEDGGDEGAGGAAQGEGRGSSPRAESRLAAGPRQVGLAGLEPDSGERVYSPGDLPIAVVAFNRPVYLRRALASRLAARGVSPHMVVVFQVTCSPASSRGCGARAPTLVLQHVRHAHLHEQPCTRTCAA